MDATLWIYLGVCTYPVVKNLCNFHTLSLFLYHFLLLVLWQYALLSLFYARSRCTGQEERNILQLLSGTVHRYNLYHNYPKAYTLLLFQPDRALRANRKYGRVRFYAPAGLGREALTR